MSWYDSLPAGARAELRDAGRVGATRFEGPEYRAPGTGHDPYPDEEPCLLCGAPIDVKGDGHEDWCMGFDS